jgi:hypothetical protein
VGVKLKYFGNLGIQWGISQKITQFWEDWERLKKIGENWGESGT